MCRLRQAWKWKLRVLLTGLNPGICVCRWAVSAKRKTVNRKRRFNLFVWTKKQVFTCKPCHKSQTEILQVFQNLMLVLARLRFCHLETFSKAHSKAQTSSVKRRHVSTCKTSHDKPEWLTATQHGCQRIRAWRCWGTWNTSARTAAAWKTNVQNFFKSPCLFGQPGTADEQRNKSRWFILSAPIAPNPC